MKYLPLLALLFAAASLQAQTGAIKGRIFDESTNAPIPFANVALQNTALGGVSDIDGNYSIENITPGLYNVQTTYVGYRSRTIFEVQVGAKQPVTLNIGLNASGTDLGVVEITTQVFERDEESPLSLQTIGKNEIQRNPGGNRDISRAIQVLPGVASSLSFRNDIIIRGGAPNENRFYLDGIEIPIINHFATQGSSGGPVGILNVNFIESVDLYSGAFPANRSNALSAVLEFTQKDGNEERLKTNFTVSATDIGFTLDGPLSEKTTYIFSARRSYLQFLFGIIGLPFLPTFNDSQFKIKHRFNQKNEITFVGIGAYDTFELNEDAALEETDPVERQRLDYILGNLPVNEQWNYTVGANYKHFSGKGFQNVVISRSHLRNTAVKYEGNDESVESNLILDYASEEIENKLRLEHTERRGGYRINLGVNAEDVTFYSKTFNRINLPNGGLSTVDFDSRVRFQRFGFFGSVSRTFAEERLLLSLGVRSDWNNFVGSMEKPLDQFSPRFSMSYSITPELSFNANVGRYYQLPPYTVFGHRDANDNLVNRDNRITYINSDHAVAGLQYIFPKNTKVSVEGFYKWYSNYPISLRDSISLANQGADFGVIGNVPVESSGTGRAYGIEFLVQRKLYNGLFGIAALTLVRSEFSDAFGQLAPSSWDNGYILSLTAGKRFAKNWEFGTRIRALGGTPFTPFDRQVSSLKEVWDIRGQGVLDFSQLNTLRNPNVYQVDVRLDKKYFFDKWSLNVYIDIENVTNAVFQLEPFIDVQRNEAGMPVEDPGDPSRYLLSSIENTAGTLLPSIGIVVEF
jgi:hypothetical protein